MTLDELAQLVSSVDPQGSVAVAFGIDKTDAPVAVNVAACGASSNGKGKDVESAIKGCMAALADAIEAKVGEAEALAKKAGVLVEQLAVVKKAV